jgi:TRAP-type C4-dicarboxylate transport system permease small subunit
MNKLNTLIQLLFKVELFIGVLTLTVIVIMNCANLLSRWILNYPFDWILEISLILFVYSVMFIVPVLYKEKGFIQMHLIEDTLGPKAREVLGIIVEFLILIFFAYLLPHALKLSLGQINMQSRGLGIPRTYITIPVFISATLCIPVCISNLAHAWQRLREKS